MMVQVGKWQPTSNSMGHTSGYAATVLKGLRKDPKHFEKRMSVDSPWQIRQFLQKNLHGSNPEIVHPFGSLSNLASN
jgi:hypothetical protein